MKLRDLVNFNPTVRLLSDGQVPFVDMAALPQFGRAIRGFALREQASSGARFANGDTLLARITPCLENGKGAQVRILPDDTIGQGSTEFIVLRAKVPSDSDFTYYVSRHPDFRHYAIRQMTGTSGRQRVAWQSLVDYELPDLQPHQRKSIGLILGTLDDKIELNRRMNETLEATARAIFKDWFVDFGPTRAKLEGRAPYLAPDIWSLFPDRLDNLGKPEGWTSSTIGQEVEVVGGSTPSTKEPAFWGGDVSWATPKDLSSLNTPVLLSTERQITGAGLSQIGSGLLPVGTVLLSSRAPIGYMAIAQIPVAVNQGFIAMICNRRLSNVFVWLWTQANMEIVHQKANGSTFQEISKSNFRPIAATVPKGEVLRAFDEAVTPLFDRIVANEIESKALATMRDFLLPKLMSGEVRVKDAEKLVGEAT